MGLVQTNSTAQPADAVAFCRPGTGAVPPSRTSMVPPCVQGYCVVPADKRFLLLFTFLKKNASKKVR